VTIPIIREESGIVQANNAGTSISLTSAVQALDRLIVWRGSNNILYSSLTAPTLSGVTFTEICVYAGSGTRPHLRCWHGVLAAGGAQSVTCGQLGSAGHNNVAVVLQGSAPLTAGATPTAGQVGAVEGVHTAPAVTVSDTTYLRYSMVQARGPDGTTDYGLPASWTLVAEITGTNPAMLARRTTFAAAVDFTQGGGTWDEYAANSSAWVAPSAAPTSWRVPGRRRPTGLIIR
jgi:hypothetical protein